MWATCTVPVHACLVLGCMQIYIHVPVVVCTCTSVLSAFPYGVHVHCPCIHGNHPISHDVCLGKCPCVSSVRKNMYCWQSRTCSCVCLAHYGSLVVVIHGPCWCLTAITRQTWLWRHAVVWVSVCLHLYQQLRKHIVNDSSHTSQHVGLFFFFFWGSHLCTDWSLHKQTVSDSSHASLRVCIHVHVCVMSEVVYMYHSKDRIVTTTVTTMTDAKNWQPLVGLF